MKPEERFDSSKPQFRRRKEKESKFVLDERFSSVLTDSRFQLDSKDKYGRKKKGKKGKKSAGEELSVFYTVNDEDTDKEATNSNGTSIQKKPSKKTLGETGGDDHSVDDENLKEKKSDTEVDASDATQPDKESEDPASRIAFLTALSRGQVDVSSSSSDESDVEEDSDSESEGSDDESVDPHYGESGILDPEHQEESIEITHEASRVLAVMNLDWTQIRATDVLAIVGSFTPAGAVRRIRVFPSDFGMKRIAEEDQFGPRNLWKRKKVECPEPDDDSDSVDSSREPAKEIIQSDFDPERLRKYEASKLKYYFAVVEFQSAADADKAYKEIDGMEFEHSSAAVDLRAIPESDLDDIIKDRPMRDEATRLPSNYVPPEFVVSALQQTNVQCSWEAGDAERERVLTKYSSGLAWENMAENDDIKAYLASDVSSDEDGDDEQSDNEKRSSFRKLMGLDSDDDEAKGTVDEKPGAGDASEEEAGSESDDDDDDDDDDVDQSMTVTLSTGNDALEQKIRSKISNPQTEELTPFEKYKEKRKQKRRERRQAAREKKKELKESRSQRREKSEESVGDSFFTVDDDSGNEKKKLSTAELELLVAGDDGDANQDDFDMRELQRMEKNKTKNLRGSRKRKEEKRAAQATGTDFQVDVHDSRFQSILDGQDERFGIDRTDPNYKETPAMREILAEQARRRKKRRKKSSSNSDDAADTNTKGSGRSLDALVKSVKSKVPQ